MVLSTPIDKNYILRGRVDMGDVPLLYSNISSIGQGTTIKKKIISTIKRNKKLLNYYCTSGSLAQHIHISHSSCHPLSLPHHLCGISSIAFLLLSQMAVIWPHSLILMTFLHLVTAIQRFLVSPGVQCFQPRPYHRAFSSTPISFTSPLPPYAISVQLSPALQPQQPSMSSTLSA